MRTKNSLIKKENVVCLPGQMMAVDVRKDMLNMPVVMDSLTYAEKMVFFASTKLSISELEEKELCEKVSNLAKFVAKDAGIRQVEPYDVARFLDILRRYYNTLSIAQIKLAFEMAMAGELDEYLPRDKDGNPDNNHYQSFSVEYVTKVLNAFKKKNREVEIKAYDMMPKHQEPKEEQKEYFMQFSKNQAIYTYLQYKYTGKLDSLIGENVIYQELERLDLAIPVRITEKDRKAAMHKLLRKAQSGLIKPFVAECIRRSGTKHDTVNDSAYFIARYRAICESLDIIIKEEIQLIELIK
jgi:hypothetical protein